MIPELPKTVAETIKHFTGRTWLLPTILNWLEQTDQRLFILTGAAGSGKSNVMAWLAGAGPACSNVEARSQLAKIRSNVGGAHFCIADTSSIDPRQLSKNLAGQLADNNPRFVQILAPILLNQVQFTSQAQERLAPDANNLVSFLENLNLSHMSGRVSFNLLVREPLKQLYAEGFDQLTLLLIDSLDDAEAYTGDSKICRLLTTLDDLPKQVRVLATSLPDPNLLTKYFVGIKPFDLITDAPIGNGDVRLYAFRHLNALPHRQRKKLAVRIDEAARGNLLYATLVLQDLEPRLASIVEVETIPLPDGLSGIYQEFLQHELAQDKDRWANLFRPLLGAIALAYGKGFNRLQLERIVGQEIQPALQIVNQFLVGEFPDGPFRLRHQSFSDFLFDPNQNAQYAIDPTTIHCRIAMTYRQQYHGNWVSMDEYGSTYLVKHLLEADVEKKLGEIHDNRYAPRHLFYHMRAAGRADGIEKLIDRVCGQ